MDEEDFGDEVEDEGGMFMDPDDDDDEGRRSRWNLSPSASSSVCVFKGVPELDEDDDDGELR